MKRSLPVVILFGLVMFVGATVVLQFVQSQTGGARDGVDEDGDVAVVYESQPETVDSQLGDLPSDIPVYPIINTANTFVTIGDDGSFILGLESKDSVSDISSFYQTELILYNWHIDSIIDLEDGVVMTIQKGERAGAVSINTDENMTIVSMTVGIGEERAGL